MTHKCPTCGTETNVNGEPFASDFGLKLHHKKVHGTSLSEHMRKKEESDAECPTCGKSCLSQRGVEYHHAKVHGERISQVEVICSECGEERKISKTRNKNRKTDYCKECWQKVPEGEESPSKIDPVIVQCPGCNEEREFPPHIAENRVGWHQECYYEHLRNVRGEDHPSYIKNDPVECPDCGFTRRLQPNVIESMESKRCEKCRLKRLGEDATPPTPKEFLVEETGRVVKSGWEAEIDRRLYQEEVPHSYEKDQYDLGECYYTPDFFVSDWIVIEIKGYTRDDDRRKGELFMENYKGLYICIGDKVPCHFYFPWDKRELGINLIQVLYDEFPTLTAALNADREDFMELEGIGEKMADTIFTTLRGG